MRRITGLLVLTLALAGLAVADGHEQVVTLGTSGGSVTLVAGDEDMYRVSGSEGVFSIETRVDGTPLAAIAENGNRYTLSMEDGMWMATFVAPAATDVALGMSGESVAVQRQEDGSYMAGDMALVDAMGTVTASNGNSYMISGALHDGHYHWSATYVASEQEVGLGVTGQMITLVKAEDGTYWLGDVGIMDGSTVNADNGNVYALSMGADGMWMATFQYPDPTMVALGSSGASVTFQRHEDGSYSLVSLSQVTGLMAAADGGYTVTASNGNVYMLAMMDGAWTPTFQAPDPQMVMLGASGDTVSIQKAEDGTYWLGSDLVSDGDTTMSSDGRSYTLSLADGMWMAAYAAPTTDVPLGTSGESAMLVLAEDGTYWLGDALVVSGETMATTMDGYNYTLSMDEDGMWMATYMPVTQQVAVGNTGISVTAVRDESGAWSFVNPLDGSNVPLVDGMEYPVGTSTYRASYADGVWTATYVAREVMVALGTSGEMVTLVVAEDGTYWLGDALVVSGETMATSSYGVVYSLSLGEDGMWSAAPMGNQVMVTLGISGDATLVLAEDGTWWHGSDQVADGSVVSAQNGNMYRINMGEDGMWMATYVPAEMEVMGTTLTAMANEAPGTGYTVDGASLPASGMGNITTSDGAMYRVHMADEMLHGARYDTAQHGDSDDRWLRVGTVDFIGDDRDTESQNEAGTMLKVNGENFSVADLLGGGMASHSGDNIVAEALKEVTKLQSQAKAYQALNEELDVTDYNDEIVDLWTEDANVQASVNKIFGGDAATPVVDVHEGTDPTVDTVLERLDMLVTALSSADAFAAATAEDGDGILESAGLSAANAMKYFDATKSESMTFYRTTANTRYGVYWQRTRNIAADDLMFDDNTAGTSNTGLADGSGTDVGNFGAFGWGLIPDTISRLHLPTTGTMYYQGGTLAVNSTGDEPVLYEGTIEVQLSLTRNSISAVVSDLRNMDGEALVLSFREVHQIALPTVTPIPNNLIWPASTTAATRGVSAAVTDGVTVYYRVAPGLATASTTMDGNWRGYLLGTNNDEATAVVGDWWIGATGNTDENTLTGSYGAERVERPEPPAPPVQPLAEAKTNVGLDPDMAAPTDAAAAVRITDAGDLRISFDPAATNTAPTSDDRTYSYAVSQLKAGGLVWINGETHIDKLTEYIAAQRRILQGWIDLDATDTTTGTGGNDDSTYSGRDAVWTAIRTQLLDRIYGDDGTDTALAGVMAAAYPLKSGTAGTDAVADDTKGLAFLDRLDAAIGSQEGWEDARHDGGFFWNEDADPEATYGTIRASGDAFTRREDRIRVGFGTTDYTRFGFWRREYTEYANHGWQRDRGTGTDSDAAGFAYSPLDQVKYTSVRQAGYPKGTAHYSGTTIVTQDNKHANGNVSLSVTWAADWDGSAATSGSVSLVVSDLLDGNGLAPTFGGAPVGSIIFTGTVTHGTGGLAGVAGSTVRVAYANRFTPDATTTGEFTGKFAGAGIDGPQAVLGTWTTVGAGIVLPDARSDTDSPIVGGFGADRGMGP